MPNTKRARLREMVIHYNDECSRYMKMADEAADGHGPREHLAIERTRRNRTQCAAMMNSIALGILIAISVYDEPEPEEDHGKED